MGLLNFDEITIEKKKSPLIPITVGVIAAIGAIGFAVASLITINTGSAIEFGQGVAQTVACDSNGITATPIQSFVNEDASGTFTFNEIVLDGIASTCAGNDFVIKVLDENGEPLNLSRGGGDPYNQIHVYFAPLTTSSEVDINGTLTNMFSLVGTGSEYLVVSAINGLDQIDSDLEPGVDWTEFADPVPFWKLNATSNSVSIVLNPDPSGVNGLDGFADSRHVYRITVESMNHVPK